MKEPLSPPEAKALVREILKSGAFVFGTHSKEEMAKEHPPLTVPDCVNVLRAGTYEEAEHENGQWRYRARTQRIVVVFSFRDEHEIRIVTAWRHK